MTLLRIAAPIGIACAALVASGAPVLAQGTGQGGITPRYNFARSQKPTATGADFVLPTATVFKVELVDDFALATAKVGDRIRVRVVETDPRLLSSPTSTGKVPIRSNVSARLPDNCFLEAQVLETPQANGVKSAVVLFDTLIGRDGERRPFLGAMSTTDDVISLPRWLEDGRYDDQSHASAMESMAVVLPWAADLGPIGIGLASFLTHKVQNRRMAQRDIQRRVRATLSFVDGDIAANTAFYVVATRDISYKEGQNAKN